jgi:hypothetical protein
MLRFRVIMVTFALLLLANVATAQSALTVADFERLHKELGSSKEPWQEIPWRLSLLDARAAAAKENKPIYMLVRSGHPLGCV